MNRRRRRSGPEPLERRLHDVLGGCGGAAHDLGGVRRAVGQRRDDAETGDVGGGVP